MIRKIRWFIAKATRILISSLKWDRFIIDYIKYPGLRVWKRPKISCIQSWILSFAQWRGLSLPFAIYESKSRYSSFPLRQVDLIDQPSQVELDRLDIKHHVITLLCGGQLHLAPLLRPQRILDIGTGTGIWVMEMADSYPDAKIIGTDLSPVQPSWYEAVCQVRSHIAGNKCLC